jgi:hypothetical protein
MATDHRTARSMSVISPSERADGQAAAGETVISAGTIKESTYYVPGLVALGVIQASFMSLVISVTAQREAGILKRRRSTPVPAWVLIASRGLICVGTAIVNAVVLIVLIIAIWGAAGLAIAVRRFGSAPKGTVTPDPTTARRPRWPKPSHTSSRPPEHPKTPERDCKGS